MVYKPKPTTKAQAKRILRDQLHGLVAQYIEDVLDQETPDEIDRTTRAQRITDFSTYLKIIVAEGP